MNRYKETVLALAFVIMLAVTAWATDRTFQDPDVDYSADEIMETEGAAMQAKVYHAQGKERREHLIEGIKQTMIMRPDRGLVWMLMPEQNMYMEMKMGQGREDAGDLKDYKIEYSAVGEEVVNGMSTTKNKVIVTDKKGNQFSGFMWVSTEGIMVKMDAVSKVEGTKMRVKLDRKNIRVEKQDTRLFEIPPGYKKMSMPSMGGGFNMQDMMGNEEE